MRRREFVITGGCSSLFSINALAQEQKLPAIGYLASGVPDSARMNAFQRGLKDQGLSTTDFRLVIRSADENYDVLRKLADQFVEENVSLIVATGIPAALAARASTSRIPIVFSSGADPIAMKLVSSLSKPGGNMTGVSNLNVEISSKRLEFLHQVTRMQKILLVVNEDNPQVANIQIRETQVAAARLNLEFEPLRSNFGSDLRGIFSRFKRDQSIIIGNDGLFIRHVRDLGALASEFQIPTAFQYREFCESGGLLAYGNSPTEQYRLLGIYAARVFRGENPAVMPIIQSSKLDLIVNLKEAKSLGLNLPLELLTQAEEVIE